METVYRAKRYKFLIPIKGNKNKYLCDPDKTAIGKRIYQMAKDGYECVYPVRKVVNTDSVYKTGEIDETDCFYETEMKKVN